MKKVWKWAAVLGAAVLVGPAFAAVPAGATPPTGYGFDNTSHAIVGGGSDTTYRAMTGITALWDQSVGCQVTTAVGPDLGKCVAVVGAETNTLGNYERDTVVQANPVGSGAGLSSLNGVIPAGQLNTSYSGAVNPVPGFLGSTATGPNIDFGRSSRGPKTTGGNAIGGNELAVDTFWGYGQDGIEVTVFNARGAQVQARPAPAITPTELFKIYNCDFTQWSQVPSLGITVGSATDGPIVPWGMNTSSGTFATFQSYIQANATGVPANWSPDGQACDRKLANGTFPFENDIKPLINNPAALSASATSVDNPVNWVWWGSFGEFSAFPFKSSVARNATQYTAFAAPVNGVLPSSSRIIANTYPIGRTLYHVTRNQEADCPQTVPGTCDFVGNPGPAIAAGGTDLKVTGATGGTGGAVREFTRFICRQTNAQQSIDPYTGTNMGTEITSAINAAGFTVVPVGLRTAGSRCQVLT